MIMQGKIFFIIFCTLLMGSAMSDTKKTYGYIEKVTLVEQNLTLSAKLDTGAKSASLNATNIKHVDVAGVQYLKFTVPGKDKDTVFQCEYVGRVNIKMRSLEAKISNVLHHSISRPVVLMRVKIGSEERIIRVNLTNRKHFMYPILLGRDAIIAFNGIVDPNSKYNLPGNNLHEKQ
jgi:hypothetical protein